MCRNNMPLKCQICHMPNYLMYSYGESMTKYLLYMNSVASTMWAGMLYTDDNDANNDANTDDNAVQLYLLKSAN